MPRKGMRSLLFSSSPSSLSSMSPFSSPSRFGFSPSRPSFSESVMDRTLTLVEPMIMKWNTETTEFAKVTSLFYENRREAKELIKYVNNLQKAMQLLATENSNSDKLVRAQNLMQISMKRLQKEFYQILSMNRAHLDPESVSTRSSSASIRSSLSDYDDDDDDDVRLALNESITDVEDASSLAMDDLRSIAECMISSGYGKECVKIFKIIRKSIVDEGIYRLGVEKFTSSHIHKMDWDSLELRIKNWLNAIDISVKTLFNGERILCDHVFATSDSIRESCFNEITKDAAMILFGFPENVAKKSKKSPDKVFRVLDMYTAISDRWPEIESVFSFDSANKIKSQALTSLVKLGEFVRTALHEFESSITKDSSKSSVAGAGVDRLNIEAMNYLTVLADYSTILADIFADSPPRKKHALPESYFGFSDSDESPAPTISMQFAWLILVLLCKLGAKANYYKDVSFSYLFLANNLQHIVVRVHKSNLKYLLGDQWLAKNEMKVKQFASNYERLAWGHTIDSMLYDPMTMNSTVQVREVFKRFNSSFEQAHRKQLVCVVPDSKLRDDIKVSLASKIVPVYREFYDAHWQEMRKERNAASILRFTPEDVGHHLSDLFFWHVDSGSSSSFGSSSTSR